MGKKKRISTIILTVVVSMCLIVGLVRADPYFYGGEMPPPAGTQPPKVSVVLENNSLFLSNNISFKVTASNSPPIIFSDNTTFVNNPWFLTDVWYTVDWQEGNTSVYHASRFEQAQPSLFRYVNLTNVPEGNHNITVFANEYGTYATTRYMPMSYYFDINSSAVANFIIDTIRPIISFSGIYQNQTFDTKEIALNFTVNKPDCQISYSLDNQSETRVNSDNSLTLNNLANGEHNVTIYAKDNYGVLSAPSTAYFDVEVPAPFPTLTIVAIALVVMIILVASVGLPYPKAR